MAELRRRKRFNHAVVMDGMRQGPQCNVRPMECCPGVYGCTDVVMILRKAAKNRLVKSNSRRTRDWEQVFTHVKLIYKLKGKNLKPAAVERAIKLSEEKYCSATPFHTQN
jgi:putative redox protein